MKTKKWLPLSIALFLFISFTLILINKPLGSSFSSKADMKLDDTQLIDNITYSKEKDIKLALSILSPKEKQGLLPAIIYIHGGSWLYGSRKEYLEVLSYFNKKGFIIVSIDYRFSNQSLFPAQLIDCCNALQFIEDNAEEYSIDKNRIGCFGISAGGYLAALMGTGIKDTDTINVKADFSGIKYPIKAVCTWSAPTDMETGIEACTEPLKMLFGGTIDEKRQLYKSASPINNITASTPPFLIFHGEKDNLVPVGTAESFYAKLIDTDRPAEFVKLPDQGHTLSGLSIFEKMDEFFRKWLV